MRDESKKRIKKELTKSPKNIESLGIILNFLFSEPTEKNLNHFWMGYKTNRQ